MSVFSKHEIGNQQLQIIAYVKNYISKCKKLGVDVANSSFCFLTGYNGTLGNITLKLKFCGLGFFFTFTKYFLLDFRNISTIKNYKINKEVLDKKKFKNLVISSVTKNDFMKNGSYLDSYFKTNSKNFSKTLWFLISADDYCPSKTDDNVIIFSKKKTIIKYNLFYLINVFFKTLLKVKFSPIKMLHEFSFFTQFSNTVTDQVLTKILKKNFKKVIITYEAQPFQNNIFNKVKKYNNKIRTIGIYHTSLHPLPISLMYRSGNPDELMISGNFQKKILLKHLKWPASSVKTVPAFRYIKKNIIDMSGFIFLPNDFISSKIIVKEFESFLKKNNPNSIGRLKIRNHPHKSKSKKHIKLIKDLENIIKKYQDRFSKKSNKESIFIGSTTSIIIALETKVNAIHICENPVFESYNDKIWKPLKVEQIGDKTFFYKLKKRNNLINFSKRGNMLRQHCSLN